MIIEVAIFIAIAAIQALILLWLNSAARRRPCLRFAAATRRPASRGRHSQAPSNYGRTS